LERDHVTTRAGDVPHSQADNSRLMALFPDARPVPFVDGLRRTVEWMRSTKA
jgi:UDP-glucose 4-epimerase